VRMKTAAVVLALFISSTVLAQSARDYYTELYKAGGLDPMADGYVCFADDTANENFFIFGESKYMREALIDNGKFAKLPKGSQELLNHGYLVVHGYTKGVPMSGSEIYRKDEDSWVSEPVLLHKDTRIRVRITIAWATLRYKRSAEILNLDSTLRSEVSPYGRCEQVSPDIPQKSR
jgi:hypothetical protein